eukprot:TRINITY_DN109112_c0_g1_i1.p1 TRINITY_DN109112_c0_g1~~TRINITY_DN109112_c0_g1_i1.p1  ORF type:complete len:566 (+),score=83.13 TRINITY_DN109112_c0_g1_i1:77-1774(+)
MVSVEVSVRNGRVGLFRPADQKHGVSEVHLLQVILSLVAMLSYVGPASVAVRNGNIWFAAVFAAVVVIGVAHLSLSSEAFASSPLSHLSPHPLFFAVFEETFKFALLQLAFAALGPEDPFLQKVQATGERADTMMLWWRAAPAIMLCFGLIGPVLSRTSASDAPMVLEETAPAKGAVSEIVNPAASLIHMELMLFLGCAMFWFGTHFQRMRATDILLRRNFWQRAWRLLLLPGMCLGAVGFLADVEMGRDERIVDSALHIAIAASSATLLHQVLGGQEEVFDRSPRSNPVVVHMFLFLPLALMTVTLGIALSLDAWAHGGWRWATISMSATTPESAKTLQLGLPFCAASAAVVIWIIGTAVRRHAEGGLWKQRLLQHQSHGDGAKTEVVGTSATSASGPGKMKSSTKAQAWQQAGPGASPWRLVCCQLGCQMGYVSLLFGFCAGAVMVEGNGTTKNILHNSMAIAFFVCLLSCIMLLVAGSEISGPAGQARILLLVLLVVSLASQLALFLLVNQIVVNAYALPHWLYASSEYASLLFACSIPVTWVNEVKASISYPPTLQRQTAA